MSLRLLPTRMQPSVRLVAEGRSYTSTARCLECAVGEAAEYAQAGMIRQPQVNIFVQLFSDIGDDLDL